MSTSSGDFWICYGSHTGQSEAIAKQIFDQTSASGLRPTLLTLNELRCPLDGEPVLVIVCSSTGDGEPPENARSFLRRISSLSGGSMNSTTFALLGLGDSNFSTYQGNPRQIGRHLLRCGAKKLIETGAADDQVGLELVVEPWLKKLYIALSNRFNAFSMPVDDPLSTLDVQLSQLDLTHSDDCHQYALLKSALNVVDINWPSDKPSLMKGSDELTNEKNLRVPVAVLPYLRCEISTEKLIVEDGKWQNGSKIIGAVGEIFTAQVVSNKWLTGKDVIKPKFEIQVEYAENDGLLYEPGDAFYIIVPNTESEVNFILYRMGLLDVADNLCNVRVNENTQKRNACVPPFLPSKCSLRYIFTNCLDIRRSPGRPLLRVLAECTSNVSERRRLLELCSAQGMLDFTKFIRQAGLTLVDFLLNFSSCRPTPDRLIELLPRLLPRPYSISNTLEKWGRRLRFVISLMKFTTDDGRRFERCGLASQWLSSLDMGEKINLIMKEPSQFRLPPPIYESYDAKLIPLVMICVGTGLAPFLSFLQKLDSGDRTSSVPRVLLYGCRSINTDCIYHDQLQRYVECGIITNLVICESQTEKLECRKHVQDAIVEHGCEISKIITVEDINKNELPMIFICGPNNQMASSIFSVLSDLIAQNTGKSGQEAILFLTELRKNHRYIEDVW